MQANQLKSQSMCSAVFALDSVESKPQPQTEMADEFFDARLRDQARLQPLQNELAMLRARLDAHGEAVVELFCLLAEHAPEVLPPRWATVADVIAAEERLWVYPSATVAQIEEETPEVFMPFLNRKRIAEEWPQLLEHARRVHECRDSGRRYGYEA